MPEIYLDIIYILAFFALLTLFTPLLGSYLSKVYAGERTFLSVVFSPLEKSLYKFAGVEENREMTWQQYAWAVLSFNFLGLLFLFLLLTGQKLLPLNPQKFSGLSWDLALNTAVSFVTNTNWQAYSGENLLSYFSQALGLTVQNFLSAATGIAILLALVRGFVRKTRETIGNFWQDLTRTVLFVFLPMAILAALILVSQGVIQNFSAYKTVPLYQPGVQTTQVLPLGPVASQEAIKLLGTNGGGFFGANSAHPFENPTPFANFFEVLLILLLPAALTNLFGRMAGKPREGWAIYTVMLGLLLAAVFCLYWAENQGGSPLLKSSGIAGYYMEGKEIRFGPAGAALFSAATTATSCGAVNNMHDSLTPLGGMIPLLLILLGEVVFGGVGCGLYTMLAFVIIAVFVAGLMIGRTPEYLGKKIEVAEMWYSVLIVLTAGVVTLILVAVSLMNKTALSSILNPGAHGLTEMLYAFASASNNNGSAFAGLNANTVYFNLTTSLAMLLGRFVPATAALALAGSLVRKKYTPPGIGTLPTDQLAFILWLVVVILIIGALTFFPALALGPIVEQLLLKGGGGH